MTAPDQESKHYPHPDITKHFDGDACSDQGNRTSELEQFAAYVCIRDSSLNEAVIIEKLQRLISQEAEQAAYDANRAVIKEQKKYLDNMTLSDGVTVIPALAVGMMYACANKLAEPLEENIKRRRLDALQGGTKG